MVLLQIGVPGGVELLVILLIFLLLFGVPLVLIVGGGALYLRSKRGREDRIEELEAEVARLSAEVGSGTDDTDHQGRANGGEDASDESTTDDDRP